VALDQGLSTFEKTLCSAFNPTNGQFTVAQFGSWNGRGYDGTAAVGHVPQVNIPQVILTWSAVEAAEVNLMVSEVMGGAATAAPGTVLTVQAGVPTWQVPGGGATSGLFPIGGILLWAMSIAYPTGFLECNGQLISQTTFSNLYAILGTTYGSGSGTFGLPNFRSKFPVGYQAGGTAGSVGASGGTRTISVGQMPAHSHGISDPGHAHAQAPQTAVTTSSTIGLTSTAVNQAAFSAVFSTAAAATGVGIQNTGSGQAFDPPFIGMAYLMRCA
jgi:microcystin-dependent protein